MALYMYDFITVPLFFFHSLLQKKRSVVEQIEKRRKELGNKISHTQRLLGNPTMTEYVFE